MLRQLVLSVEVAPCRPGNRIGKMSSSTTMRLRPQRRPSTGRRACCASPTTRAARKTAAAVSSGPVGADGASSAISTEAARPPRTTSRRSASRRPGFVLLRLTPAKNSAGEKSVGKRGVARRRRKRPPVRKHSGNKPRNNRRWIGKSRVQEWPRRPGEPSDSAPMPVSRPSALLPNLRSDGAARGPSRRARPATHQPLPRSGRDPVPLRCGGRASPRGRCAPDCR